MSFLLSTAVGGVNLKFSPVDAPTGGPGWLTEMPAQNRSARLTPGERAISTILSTFTGGRISSPLHFPVYPQSPFSKSSCTRLTPNPKISPGSSNSLSVIEHPQSSSNQLEYPLLHNLNRLILDFARAPTVKSLRQLIRSSSGYRAVRTSKAYNPSPLDLISQPVTKAIAGWFYRTNSGTLTFGPKTTRCSARPLAHLLSRIHLGQYGGGPNFSEALAQVIPHPDTKTFEEKNPLPSTRI